MAKITVTVCDVCEQQPTTHYRITSPDNTYTLDLCPEHARPLARLLETVAAEVPHRRRFKSTVTTIEEIERRKHGTL